MFLDGRLDRQRRIRRDRREIRGLMRVPGPRHRNAQLLRQPKGPPGEQDSGELSGPPVLQRNPLPDVYPDEREPDK